jgi:multiple sugar transport system substrate-binding protein
MKNRIRLILSILLATMFVIGAIQTPARAADKTKVTIATWTGVDESKEFQAVIDKVNAAASDFQIILNPIPQDYYTQIQTQMAGGTGADLFWLDQDHIASRADSGALLDISDRVAKADKGSAADLTDYFPDVLQTAQSSGKTFGLPWIAQPVMLYFNKDIFDAAQMKYPDDTWTWDTFRDAAAKLTVTKDSKITQYGTSFNGWPPPDMFVWQAGGSLISLDRKSSPIDSPEVLQAVNYYTSILYNEKYSPSEATLKEQGFSEMFKAGKIAMFMGGAADDLDRVPNLKVGMARVPMGPKNRTTFTWTASTVINAATKNPDAAYKALVAVTEGIQHWKIMAPRKSLATAEVIAASEPRKKDNAAVIVSAAADMRSLTTIPRQAEWADMFWKEFLDKVYHHTAKAEDIAKQVRTDLEALLPK